MPRGKKNPFAHLEFVQAKDAFTGDMDTGDRDDDGHPILEPIVVSPNDIFEVDHPFVRKWPHHFKPFGPTRQRPAVEQATQAPGETRPVRV